MVIIRYSSIQTAQAWNGSELRAEWISRLRDVTGEVTTGAATTSFDTYPTFTNVFNSSSSSSKSKWSAFWVARRTWLLIWLQVYSLVQVFGYLLPLVLGRTWENLPPLVKLFIDTGCTTLAMDLVAMPIVFGLAKRVGFI